MDALSIGIRPVHIRRCLRSYLLFLALSLSGVALLYTLQSDLVPNVLLLKLYKTETSWVAHAAETPATLTLSPRGAAPALSAGRTSPLPSSPSTFASGSDFRGEDARTVVDRKRTSPPTLASRRVLSLLLHFHSATKAEEQKQRHYARDLLAAIVASPPHFPSVSSGGIEGEGERDTDRQTEPRAPNEEHLENKDESIEEHFWNANSPVLHHILRQWHHNFPYFYRILFAAHALAKRFEFLPLMLLVCSSAVGLLSLFVALHVYLVSDLAPRAPRR